MADKADSDLTLEDLEVADDELEDDDEIEDDENDDDDASGDDDDAGTPPDDKASSSTNLSVEDISKKLTELESNNAGLLGALSAQRNERRELQTRLDEMQDVLKAVVDQASGKPPASDDIEDDANDTIALDFDADGNPFLSADKLKAFESDTVKQLKAKIAKLEAVTTDVITQTSNDRALESVLKLDPSYKESYEKISEAWTFLRDEAFDADRLERGLPVPKTAEEAIDMAIESPALLKTFNARFPGLDLESIMEANLVRTPRILKKALKSVSALLKTDTTDKGLEKLDKTKPTSLAQSNSSGGENSESLLTRIADMDPADFAKLDEKTMAKVDKLLEQFG